MTASTHAPSCVFRGGPCPSGCVCGCHEGRINGACVAVRKVGPARIEGPRLVTYTCACNEFTITDTGDEAKREWAKHLRIGAQAMEVAS